MTHKHTHTHTRSCQSSSLTMKRKYKTPWGVERRVGSTDDALYVCVCSLPNDRSLYTTYGAQKHDVEPSDRIIIKNADGRTLDHSPPSPLPIPIVGEWRYARWIVTRKINESIESPPWRENSNNYFFEFQHYWRQFFFFFFQINGRKMLRQDSHQLKSSPIPNVCSRHTHTQRFVEFISMSENLARLSERRESFRDCQCFRVANFNFIRASVPPPLTITTTTRM